MGKGGHRQDFRKDAGGGFSRAYFFFHIKRKEHPCRFNGRRASAIQCEKGRGRRPSILLWRRRSYRAVDVVRKETQGKGKKRTMKEESSGRNFFEDVKKVKCVPHRGP